MLVRLEAARRIIERTRLRRPRVVPRTLVEAVGGLAAREIQARRDIPEADVSAMDGFAVRAYRADRPRPYLLCEADPRSRAIRPLQEGQAIPIATGARLPPGANAIVRIEATRSEGELLRTHEPVRPGQDVMPRGESIRCGETILERGERIDPYHLGALLADGVRSLPVYDLRVGIIPVGDEIRGSGTTLRGTVPDLISPVIARLFEFANVRILPSVKDNSDRLRRAIAREIRRSELLVTIGGASVGRRDVTKKALSEMGEILFEGVQANVIKRGAVALVEGTPVLVLPGQIVSAVTTTHEHGLHLVGRIAGRELRRFDRAKLSEAVTVDHRMDSTYLFRVHDGQADPLPWGVARMNALLHANAFGVLERGRRWAAGDEVELQWLEHAGTRGTLAPSVRRPNLTPEPRCSRGAPSSGTGSPSS